LGDGKRVSLGKWALVPVRIDRRLLAGLIELGYLFGGKIPALGG